MHRAFAPPPVALRIRHMLSCCRIIMRAVVSSNIFSQVGPVDDGNRPLTPNRCSGTVESEGGGALRQGGAPRRSPSFPLGQGVPSLAGLSISAAASHDAPGRIPVAYGLEPDPDFAIPPVRDAAPVARLAYTVSLPGVGA